MIQNKRKREKRRHVPEAAKIAFRMWKGIDRIE
jgi:hypothetical protein